MRTPAGQIVKRLVGELVVVVLGVMIAIAADRWNQNRLDRSTATEYSRRLINELVADSVRLEEHARAATERRAECVRLYEVIRSTSPDSTALALYFDATGAPPPHRGGATFAELQRTGRLGLLPEGIAQLLFDYYGYVDGTLERLENVRRVDRSAMVEAANRSGVFMPREMVSAHDFTERLRAYPGIDGVVMGCVAAQASEAGLVTAFWLPHLSQTLTALRQLTPH
jgi:hypothetical protein